MKITTKQVTGGNINRRVLTVIEGLCYLYEDSPQSQSEAEKYISKIYRYAHIVGGCCAPADWVAEFLETEKTINKIMGKRTKHGSDKLAKMMGMTKGKE